VANRLAAEQSPYLLQHKDNPVDWYPWGEEAFSRARAEDRPIFLSIGYSTCHWCHVMEHESFEAEEIARFLNSEFVPVKVDREERPDVDDVYMRAVQMMTGQGGWPLSVFLAPDGRPFYGGTYFPPAPRRGLPGFLQLLEAVANAWKTRRGELEATAADLAAHMEAVGRAPAGDGPGPGALDAAARSFEREFDPVHGGFGGAPKFPPSMRLELLVRRFLRTRDLSARTMAETTLVRMAEGGLYDHVGGGFHRYSVDERWLVPHFEKMLYDNALLARSYLLAYRAFGTADHARVIRETLDFLLAEMTPDGGGFFAAQDADSDGEEGTFYVWDPGSLERAVGSEAAPVVAARFGVTARGNFENGQTILSVVRTVEDLASDFGREPAEITAILSEARRRMYEVRSRRVKPATDDKLLTDWTALGISAFALASRVLGEPRYEEAARSAADRILERCVRGDELLHREKTGRAGIPGFATDYAFLVEALLDLYEATFEGRYFAEAVRLERSFEERFADPAGGFFLTGAGHEALIVRPKETFDGATPSSNSVAAMNLLRLAAFTGEEPYRRRAEQLFDAFSGYLARAAPAFPRLLCALDFREAGAREVVLAGSPGREDFEALRRAVFESPGLNRVLAHADAEGDVPELGPLTRGRGSAGEAVAYVCERFTCRTPIATPEALEAALGVP
jgi:uncharacterized protein YyaL (SSP411 family)